ncbi:MAG: DNA polymerase III subunit delta' [Acidocella sp.]|nr:DNA polymerase III subunit delta' [Acidocella sp.]
MSKHPRANPDFVGHAGAVSALYHAASAGRLHHGWLITGQPGIGKATLAYRFARWLLAGANTADLSLPSDDPVFRRVAAGTHPDFFTIERRVNSKTDRLQSEIVIDTVREAISFMHHTPSEGGWRVVLIDGVEDMNPKAANALLKLLEEPPPRAVLLLVSGAPGRLLPTIRSRCRALALSALAEAEMATLLARYAPELDDGQALRLATLAEGSIGVALTLAAEGGVALAGLVDEVLAGELSPPRAQAIADQVARAVEGADKFEVFFTLLRAGLAARTRAQARAGVDAAALSRDVSHWHALGILGREVVGLNLDKRAAVVVALSQLHRV